jgi:hypothetical protein
VTIVYTIVNGGFAANNPVCALDFRSGTIWRADDIAPEIIAKKVIELAKAGERDPERICDYALANFRFRRWFRGEHTEHKLARAGVVSSACGSAGTLG